MRLIIHAPNVHQGGGRTLLLALLGALHEQDRCLLIVDARMGETPPLPPGTEVMRVAPSARGRLGAESHLRAATAAADKVLCFGNLPPLYRLKGEVLLYLQNRYLAAPLDLGGFETRIRIRISLERLWLRARLGNVDRVIVQNASVQRDVRDFLGRDAVVMPFAGCGGAANRTAAAPGPASGGAIPAFLYVATGEPHKNHEQLVAAWKLLAADGIRPELVLTLPPTTSPRLMRVIEKAAGGLRITNLGEVSPERLQQAYREAGALIYPSTMESLGLPLLEARAAGLPVIASERDYVRDLIAPEQTFDPQSPLSIARAVRRFLNGSGNPAPLPGAPDFMNWLRAPTR